MQVNDLYFLFKVHIWDWSMNLVAPNLAGNEFNSDRGIFGLEL